MPKPDSHIVTDNNDDNEFATGYKSYSVEAAEEVRLKRKAIEEHAHARSRWDKKLMKMSYAVEASGKRVQNFGKWISKVGQYLSRFAYEDYEEDRQPASPSRPTSPPNAIH